MNESLATRRVQRCARCLMPDSVPASDFDQSGVCGWCRTGFPNYAPRGDGELQALLEESRSNGPADCLVGISGGKDSLYAMLELRRKFGARVEAFTYGHDSLERFALQNARRAANILGVKHHVVSLPDHVHAAICKEFFRVWVKSESPLAASMTCVACKHLHLLGTRLAAERRIPLVVWAACPLEIPPFIPTRPAAAPECRNGRQAGTAALALKLARNLSGDSEFRRAFVVHLPTCVEGCLSCNPRSSLLNMRFPSVRHVYFFKYRHWDGKEIAQAVAGRLGWEVPGSVKESWHSDCMQTVLKEYMFQKMFLCSYTDAYLSNQIRHGLIDRRAARRLLLESKKFFASRVGETLCRMGMGDLIPRVDLSCFRVEDGEDGAACCRSGRATGDRKR